MPTPVDLAFMLLVLCATLLEHYWLWPRWRRTVALGGRRARVPVYRDIVAGEWVLSALGVVAWVAQRRPWSALPLALPQGWRLGVAVATCLVAALLLGAQVVQIRRLRAAGKLAGEGLAALRARTASVDDVAPHTVDEVRWFLPLSLTAGICEEWLFRGLITAMLAPAIGLPLAVLVCNVAFGFGHSYQGTAGIVKAGVVGCVMSGLVIVTGSLIPAMILHAVLDLGGGLTTWSIHEETEPQARSA